jgi:hypothetical protein
LGFSESEAVAAQGGVGVMELEDALDEHGHEAE